MPKGETDWDKVRAMTEEEIEANALSDPDSLPPPDEMWETGAWIVPNDYNKPHLLLSVEDPELLDYFMESGGSGYQNRMTEILRNYVASQKRQQA